MDMSLDNIKIEVRKLDNGTHNVSAMFKDGDPFVFKCTGDVIIGEVSFPWFKPEEFDETKLKPAVLKAIKLLRDRYIERDVDRLDEDLTKIANRYLGDEKLCK